MIYNDHPFYFRKNLQGDVIAITEWSGETVARYTYDAWGKCTIVDLARAHEIATVNPFRYRGYYYDSETALYYLQSRYYDPELGRFINGDMMPQIDTTKSNCMMLNIYAYCFNSPVNMCDVDGFYPVTCSIMSTIVSAFSGAYIGAAIAKYFGLTGWKKTLCVIGGATLMGLVGKFFSLSKMYSAVKSILYTAGFSYLTLKKYSIAAMAYDRGMWGGGASLKTSQKNAFIDKVKASPEYANCLKRLISRIKNGEEKPSEIIEFKQTSDLFYAIQHMTMKVRYKKSTQKYHIVMSDTYDFTEWRKIISKAGVSFANAANNLGLVMQKCGMMIPYNIDLSFEVKGCPVKY